MWYGTYQTHPIMCWYVFKMQQKWTAVSTIVNDNICEARFSLHSARNLKLATEDSNW